MENPSLCSDVQEDISFSGGECRKVLSPPPTTDYIFKVTWYYCTISEKLYATRLERSLKLLNETLCPRFCSPKEPSRYHFCCCCLNEIIFKIPKDCLYNSRTENDNDNSQCAWQKNAKLKKNGIRNSVVMLASVLAYTSRWWLNTFSLECFHPHMPCQ